MPPSLRYFRVIAIDCPSAPCGVLDPAPTWQTVYITDPPDLQSTVRAMHHACRLSCFVSCFGCHASLAHVLFAAGKPTFSRRSACLESVFYVIYVTLIMHDDSASGDDILRVNLCFGT